MIISEEMKDLITDLINEYGSINRHGEFIFPYFRVPFDKRTKICSIYIRDNKAELDLAEAIYGGNVESEDKYHKALKEAIENTEEVNNLGRVIIHNIEEYYRDLVHEIIDEVMNNYCHDLGFIPDFIPFLSSPITLRKSA